MNKNLRSFVVMVSVLSIQHFVDGSKEVRTQTLWCKCVWKQWPNPHIYFVHLETLLIFNKMSCSLISWMRMRNLIYVVSFSWIIIIHSSVLDQAYTMCSKVYEVSLAVCLLLLAWQLPICFPRERYSSYTKPFPPPLLHNTHHTLYWLSLSAKHLYSMYLSRKL